ncbi:MAG: hypothetical protein AB7O46_11880 [Xanthobacteraceae bacterium]|nr:hypothetical protein [Xanthobacteraceae bacterium]
MDSRSASALAASRRKPESVRGTLAMPVPLALLAAILCAAFALYWATSFILEAHDATTRFGADTWFYTKIADGRALARVGENYHLDRIFRFHPVTVVLGAGWMGLFGWLSAWMTPYHILKAMFALIGALNVYAAMTAFAAVMPRKHVAFWGVIYAVSLGVWFFSSIEESKIVSTALAAAYIAVYLHLRTQWSQPRAILLTVILLFACLNEIVAGFLVLIPIVDTLMQRGFDLRAGRWIAAHVLAGPLALVILELISRARTGPAGTHPEGANHASMLLWYVKQNTYDLPTLNAFLQRWFFFNLAAPEPTVHFANPTIGYGGDFQPRLLTYFYEPSSAILVALFAILLLAIFLPRFCPKLPRETSALVLGLAAFVFMRGVFFFVFLPNECMIYASSVSLSVLLLLAIPFSASAFPRRRILLAMIATALFLTNGAFLIAPQP